MKTIRVLLADDHAITREGTRQLLAAEADIEVVAEAADGREAVRLAQALRPDILVLDINMPGLNGVEVVRLLRATLPEIRVAILTGYADEQYVQALARLGIRGYLSKTASSRELVSALRMIHAGRLYLQPVFAELLSSAGESAAQDEPTQKELEVLHLMAEGRRTRDIARQLSISERDVERHIGRLVGKCRAGSRTELAHLARLRGWIT